MISYLWRRSLLAVPTLLAISLVIFLILALAPGDPLAEFATNPAITAEVRENLQRVLGLDQPLYRRYGQWLWSFFQGNLGYSFVSLTPVSNLIAERLPTTLWVVGSAYLLAFLIAFPLGIIAALRANSLGDNLINFLAFIGLSLPTFLTGILAILVFSIQLEWFPFIYNSNLEVKNLETFIAQIKQSILPITVLGFYQGALLIRFIRAAILEEINQDYIRTALAKGLNLWGILKNHLLPNALIPVITLIALDIPGIFTGALVTEQVFSVPGIGSLLIDSIERSDTPVVMAITFIYGILIIIFSLVADILYFILDPRLVKK